MAKRNCARVVGIGVAAIITTCIIAWTRKTVTISFRKNYVNQYF